MVHSYLTLLAACQPLFLQARTHALFCQLVKAWLLCTTRRTITGLLACIPGAERRTHDAYHRFFQAAPWEPDDLFDLLLGPLVRRCCPDGVVTLDVDDTLQHKSGPRVAGAGFWRDAVRSTRQHVVYALGLNLVVLTLRVTPPWGGFPLALPLRVRLHRKGGPTDLDLAEAMIRDVAARATDCHIRVCADGFYAALAPRLPRSITFTSRMRCDAALYDQPRPRPAGTRGPKPTKGDRLPDLATLAAEAAALGLFSLTTATRHQQAVERLVYARTVIWKRLTLLLVIVRDPSGQEKDDFFFTTDLDACALDLPDHYGGRWAIEVTFRDVKQLLGAQEPQCWADAGPLRAASLAYWLYSLVWYCFLCLEAAAQRQAVPQTAWYGQKAVPSFADALAWLRRQRWQARILASAGPVPAPHNNAETVDLLIEQITRVA